MSDESKKALWRFHWSVGRMGDVDGLFVATDAEVEDALGREVYFGEILGKHSEVYGTLEAKDLTRLTGDPSFISKFEEYGCGNGYNPLDYLNAEEDDSEEEEDES